MPTLVLIPALGCDGELYEAVAAGLSDLVAPRVVVVAEPTLDEAAARVLSEVEGDFAVAGASFGGNVALEVALERDEMGSSRLGIPKSGEV
jgi:thioesterase domain-containing protein